MSLFGSAGIGSALSLLAGAASKPTDVKPASVDSASFKGEMSAVDKFMKYQEMSPAEKIRASYLAAHGLTEEDVAAMDADTRKKIEEMILEEIKRKLGVKEIRNDGAG